jgi:hypothetical protein
MRIILQKDTILALAECNSVQPTKFQKTSQAINNPDRSPSIRRQKFGLGQPDCHRSQLRTCSEKRERHGVFAMSTYYIDRLKKLATMASDISQKEIQDSRGVEFVGRTCKENIVSVIVDSSAGE